MITFACPFCRKARSVKDEFGGTTGKCPHCKQSTQVPAPAKRSAGGNTERSQPAAPELADQATLQPRESEHVAVEDSQASHSWGGIPVEEYDFLAPAEAPDELGRLGPYRVLRVLGAGGMGVVFQAEDPALKRSVALKAMLPTLAASESARKRFIREAQTAAAIEHDHIVHIYQVGEDRGVPFMAMQFLKGEALDERLKREGRLPLHQVLRIGRETALGLAAAHERGLVHRDIKPANLWLEATPQAPASAGRQDSGYRVKILDFGLARAAAGDGANITQSGAVLGTPAYMAPEQANGETVDGRCDLFSLGCVLYRLSTGELPFKGKDTLSTLMALALEDPPPPVELDPSIPKDLSDLVMKLLAKEPAQRPSSAMVVVEMLSQVEKNNPVVEAAQLRKVDANSASTISQARKVKDREIKKARIENERDVPAVPNGQARWLIIGGISGGLLLLVAIGVAVVVIARPWSDNENKQEVIASASSSSADGPGDSSGNSHDSTSSSEDSASSSSVSSKDEKPIIPGDDRLVAVWALGKGAKIFIAPPDNGTFVAKIADLPKQPFVLQTVDFGPGSKLADDDLKRLAGLTQVKRINCVNQPITNTGLSHLKDLPKLTSIGLINSQMTDTGLVHLQNFPALETVYLSDSKVSGPGLANLRKLLNLKELVLQGTMLTDDDLVHLQGIAKLTRLRIGNNPLTDAGLERLGGLTQLVELDLSSTTISEKGLSHLAGLANLTKLSLKFDQLSDESMKVVGQWTTLEWLDLSFTTIKDDGLAHLKGLKQLNRLELENTSISDAGLLHLHDVKSLRSLYVKNTEVTAKGTESIKTALPLIAILK